MSAKGTELSQHQEMMIEKAKMTHKDLSKQQKDEMKSIIQKSNRKVKSMRSIERYQRRVQQDPGKATFWHVLKDTEKTDPDWPPVSPTLSWKQKEVEPVHVPSLIKEQGKMYQARNLAPFNRPPHVADWPYHAAICQLVFYSLAIKNGILDHSKKLPDLGLKKDATESKQKNRKRKLLATRKILPTHLHSEDTETVLIEGERKMPIPSSVGRFTVGLSDSLQSSNDDFWRRYYRSILNDMFYKYAPSTPAKSQSLSSFFQNAGCVEQLQTQPFKLPSPT